MGPERVRDERKGEETMPIPMTDLKVQYRALKGELDAALADVLENTAFILGPAVERFEQAFAAYHGVEHCVGVSNGTDALKLALCACGIGAGDEVLTTPFTFGATVEAICEVGAKPVFVDIEPDYFSLDVSQVEASLTARTRAIIPVHLYGHPVDMDPLLALAQDRGITVVEDAAQAHGARYGDRLVGTMGQVACFSFYPGKNLGAYGDAGGLITRDGDLAETVRRLRNHGQDPTQKFWYDRLGYNHRMDGFQGAVLDVKLRHLDSWNDLRRQHADRYRELLGGLADVALPAEAPYARHVYHLFVVRVPDREALGDALKADGVATGVQYPVPLHLTPAYAYLGHSKGDFPVCEEAAPRILALPMYPELTDEQLSTIAGSVRRFRGLTA